MTKLQNYSAAKCRRANPGGVSGKKRAFSSLFATKWHFRTFFGWLPILIALVLGGCSKPVATAPELMVAMQQMQELATVEYTVSKVVKANDNKDWFKLGDRKILFTCEASIKAGIDLAQLSNEDITINGKQIQVHLPAPKLLSMNLPPEKIRVAYSEVGMLRSDFTNEEKNLLLAQAEKQIWTSAPQTGILDQAKLNTETFMLQWLRQLGFEQIELSFDKGEPATKRVG